MTGITVGIVGAGTMGSAIAQKFAQQEFKAILVDVKDEILVRAMNSIKKTLDEGVTRKLFTPQQVNEILSRITPTTDLGELNACQIVIEAVFEDLRVKKELFQKISTIVSSDCIIATNTSSFSVSELARSITFPERFIGLHFFYHAAKNRLIEVIPGTETSSETIKKTLQIIRRLDKDPIMCKDSNGFVVNRFFVPWLNEAVRMNEEGIASRKMIDEIFGNIFGVSLGPFALMNATGVPIAYHSQVTLYKSFGRLYEPAKSLEEQALKNEPWSFQEDQNEKRTKDNNISSVKNEIKNRILGLMFFIWGQLLSEQVCNFGDIHRGAKIGLRWRNAPYQLVSRYGKEGVMRLSQKIAEKWELDLPESLASNNWEATWKPNFVLSQKRGNVGYLIVNRPEDLNALNPKVISEIERAFTKLENDADVEVIILTGTGKAFVAGADIKFFIKNIEKQRFDLIREFTKHGQDVLNRIDNASKLVITFVNGIALGGGLELALCGDLILASPRAIMGFPETGIGIYPALGGTQRTPKRVGKSVAKYLIYTGTRLDASQALEIGLIDKILTWDEIDALMDGEKNFISELISRTQTTATPKVKNEFWDEITTFLEKHSIHDIFELTNNLEKFEKLSPVERKLCKKVSKKAPIALKIAEKLINEQKGVMSELEHLETVFKTKDALLGLKSVNSNSLPIFKGE